MEIGLTLVEGGEKGVLLVGREKKRKFKNVRLGTLNVGTVTGKARELVDMMQRRKVDNLCVQETRRRIQAVLPWCRLREMEEELS